MAKPGTVLGWTGGTQTDPGTTKRNTTGYAPAEKPAAQHLNWIIGNISAWIAYLNNLVNEALTWTVKQTFSAGLSSGVAPSGSTDVVRKAELDTVAASVHCLLGFGGLWTIATGVPSPSTVYLVPPGGQPVAPDGLHGWSPAASCAVAIVPMSMRVPAGTLRNLYVDGDGNRSLAADTFTVLKNGAATALVVTRASSATSGSDLTHSVAVAAGDKVAVQWTKTAGGNGNDMPESVQVSIELG